MKVDLAPLSVTLCTVQWGYEMWCDQASSNQRQPVEHMDQSSKLDKSRQVQHWAAALKPLCDGELIYI